LALATVAAGMMTGEAVTGAAVERIDVRWLGIGLAAMGCLLCAFAWSGTAALALAVLAAFGVANGVAEVVMMTAIHEHAESAYQGRVFGVASTIWRTAMLGAVAFAPVVDALASPPQAITIAAGLLFAGGGFVYLQLRPGVHAVPAAA
jgi:MFS family permease